MAKVIFGVLCAAIITQGCDNSGIGKYDLLVKHELESGKRVDSIFYGIYLGMPSKAFFTHCWQLNKQGVFTDGTNNMYVMHRLNKGELNNPAVMNFYPDFEEGKIYNMRVLYQYDGWAPWNKKLFADTLLPDVLQLYKKQYPNGNPFITISEKGKSDIYLKVDGNRRITIGRVDDMVVKVAITDLLTERKILSRNVEKK